MRDFRRVVITGVGAVTPIGTAADGLWTGLRARTSAVRTVTRFDPTPFRSHMAAEIPDFRPQDHLDAKRAKRLECRTCCFTTCDDRRSGFSSRAAHRRRPS